MVLGGLGGTLAQGATISIVIRGVDKFSGTFNKATSGLGKLGTAMKVGGIAVAAFGTAITAVGISSLKVAADFEQTRIGFETMLGSAEKSKKFLADLADFAKKTPFTLTGVESAARKLLAVGFASEDVLPVLKDVGDIASGLGLGQQGLDRLILNLGQVQAQGKLTGRELRDFAVAGIPLLDELAKSLGKTPAEIQELVSAGEITTQHVLDAFAQMTGAGGRFEDLMSKQMDSVRGKFSNVQDSIELMQRELGNALLPTVATLTDTVLNGLLPAIQPLIPIFGDFLVNALNKTIELFNVIKPAIIKFFEESIKPNLPQLKEIGKNLFEIVKTGLKLAGIILTTLGPALNIIIPIFQAFSRILREVLELIEKIVRFLAEGPIGETIKGLSGMFKGFVGSKFFQGGINQDFISRPGQAVEAFSPQDTIIGVKNPNTMGGLGGMTINIDNVYGVDSEDISRALKDELYTKIRL